MLDLWYGTDGADRFDLTALPWWRVCRVDAVAPGEGPVPAFLEDLCKAFADQGHEVGRPASVAGAGRRVELDVLLVHIAVPPGPGTLLDRVQEQYPPLMVNLRRTGDVRGGVRNLVGVFEVDEPLAGAEHLEVVQLARVLMARVGAPKTLFLYPDPETGQILEATLCTMEGGHPSVTRDIVRDIRDRLVAVACATEVNDRLDQVPAAVQPASFDAARSPRVLAAAGRRMGRLGLLPPPHRVSDYVSVGMAAAYQRYLGIKGFSEGMMFVYDPDLQALVVTASGSFEVDKRDLKPEDVVVVDHQLDGGRLRVLSVAGAAVKGPSVEAWEVCSLMAAAPKIRVSKDAGGVWRPDPEGTVEVPAVRGGLHAHVGVDEADETLIESIAPDRAAYPYGFGCGTDLMVDVAAATVRRSQAINDAEDKRSYVRWPMLYHGEMALELWTPEVPDEPLTGLLDLFDPAGRAAIAFRTDNVDQPV
ncbi:hypothetical protein [Catenulispora subtropica]|uniref:Uncharacterized protein n=1 Tax=Catenulispora subtropica TaxID=450798 RepID=A0ABP5C6K0_9ACTN